MIKLELKCYNGHLFESKFRNQAVFYKLKAQDYLGCPTCGICEVEQRQVLAGKLVEEAAEVLQKASPGLSEVGIQIEISNF